jgi:hypothetical protein
MNQLKENGKESGFKIKNVLLNNPRLKTNKVKMNACKPIGDFLLSMDK